MWYHILPKLSMETKENMKQEKNFARYGKSYFEQEK